MRIGIFSDTYTPDVNGIVTSIVQLENELIKNGHDVFIITSSNRRLIGVEGNVILMPGFKIKRLYGYNVSNFYPMFGSQKIKSLNLDVIHVHTDFGIGMFARIMSKQFSIPLVYTYHTMFEDYTHYVTKKLFEKQARGIVASTSRVLADRCTQLIVPSDKTKDAMIRYGVTNDVNVIPTGINLDNFKKDNFTKEQTDEIRNKFGFSEDDFVTIFIGRIAQEKSVHEIIEAFNIIKQRDLKNHKLLIVGDGPQLPDLKKMVDDYDINDIVKFGGKIMNTEVGLYYNSANVFVSTATTETQGLTFIEAMASGLPVICKYDDNLADFIVDHENGFFITDCNDLADKIDYLKHLDKEQFQKHSSKALEVANDYSSDIFYKRVLEVYERSISEKDKLGEQKRFKRVKFRRKNNNNNKKWLSVFNNTTKQD